jgi:hypothetical protein
MKQVVLGTSWVLAPLAWFASLEANFALAPLACNGHGKGLLLLISIAAFVLAVASSFWAWAHRNLDRRPALWGAAMSAFFALVIAAQAIPNLILGGCE